MIGSNCKVWLEGDCRDDVSPFHFQKKFCYVPVFFVSQVTC